MGCCGENRAALRAQPRATQALPPPHPRPPTADDPSGVPVEYRGDAPILLRGMESGRIYTFSPARRVRLVAGPDTRQLLQSPLFALSSDEGRPNGTRAETAR
jgi:hypothetical protein